MRRGGGASRGDGGREISSDSSGRKKNRQQQQEGNRASASLFPTADVNRGERGGEGGMSHDVWSHDQSKPSVCDPRGEKIKDVCILKQPAGPFYTPLMLTQLIDRKHHACRQTHR